MRERCDHCGLKFLREPGYFLGSIYFNYGLTTLLVTATYLTLFLTTNVSPELLLWSLTAFCVLFPLWFFRYARALWLAMDLYFDPAKEETDRRPPEMNAAAAGLDDATKTAGDSRACHGLHD